MNRRVGRGGYGWKTNQQYIWDLSFADVNVPVLDQWPSDHLSQWTDFCLVILINAYTPPSTAPRTRRDAFGVYRPPPLRLRACWWKQSESRGVSPDEREKILRWQWFVKKIGFKLAVKERWWERRCIRECNRFNVRKQLFTCRVVNVWNSLPAARINFSSLTSFKLSLLNVDFSKFLTIDWL